MTTLIMLMARPAVATSIVVACIVAGGIASAQDSGARDYAVYCATCHGAMAMGGVLGLVPRRQKFHGPDL